MTQEQKNDQQVLKLNALYAFKMGMTQVVDAAGVMVPCTVLKYEPMTVSQLKTPNTDGYSAVQLACKPKKGARSNKVEVGHFKKSGLKSGVYFVNEILCDAKDLVLGAEVSITSLAKGDVVKVTGVSKGKGFAGAVKRWNSGGGPAAHGSCFHRQPGSSGNRTWPGRIMKGKHFPGHLGDETTSVKNLKIVDVLSDENLILVKGAVPGAKNSIVRLIKQ